MGLVGSYAPLFPSFLVFGCCRAEGGSVLRPTWVRPYTGMAGLAMGRVSLWRNWSVFRVGVVA